MYKILGHRRRKRGLDIWRIYTAARRYIFHLEKIKFHSELPVARSPIPRRKLEPIDARKCGYDISVGP